MSRVCLLSLAMLLACACAYEDAARKHARIVDDENAETVVTAELGNPLHVPCLESEDPTLFVFWYRGHGKRKLLKADAVYGMRRNALLIRSLAIDTLGPYTCQAYNSEDMTPPRMFVVRANVPDETSPPDIDWLEPTSTGAPSLGTQPPTSVETSTTSMTTTEAPGLWFTNKSEVAASEDSVRIPAGIAGDENAVVTSELGRPLQLRCLAYGYPPPFVFWYHGFNEEAMFMVLNSDMEYETRGNLLYIKRLSIDSLGQYKCGAYNGVGQPARSSWKVVVRAYKPEGLFHDNKFLVPRDMMAPRPGTELPSTVDTTTLGTTEAPTDKFWDSKPIIETSTGGGLTETTENKTGASEVETTLSATNEGTTVSSEIVVPAKCTDNPSFAFCNLIVRNTLCVHNKYYSKWCCKSCVKDGQLKPQDVEHQADL